MKFENCANKNYVLLGIVPSNMTENSSVDPFPEEAATKEHRNAPQWTPRKAAPSSSVPFNDGTLHTRNLMLRGVAAIYLMAFVGFYHQSPGKTILCSCLSRSLYCERHKKTIVSTMLLVAQIVFTHIGWLNRFDVTRLPNLICAGINNK